MTESSDISVRSEDVELLKRARIALSRQRRDDPAVIEFSRRVRTYYQVEGLSMRKMAVRFGLTAESRGGQMSHWVNKAHIDLAEPIECAAA